MKHALFLFQILQGDFVTLLKTALTVVIPSSLPRQDM